MKTNNLIWLAGSLCALSVAGLQGCGGDDDSEGGAGSGGSTSKGGSGGSGGSTGGSTAKGGSGGSTGGSGGSTAKGGSGGTTGGTTNAGGDTGEGGAGEQTRCEVYCDGFEEQCPMLFDDDYGNTADCLTACADFEPGDVGDDSGDTLECRITHTGFATELNDDPHCDHASESQEAQTGGCI